MSRRCPLNLSPRRRYDLVRCCGVDWAERHKATGKDKEFAVSGLKSTETEWVFNRPRHGWTCFFCGETFRTPGAAELHFGAAPFAEAACRIKVEEFGLLAALRKAEAELASYRAEDSDADRAMYRMQAEHAVALRREEEKGYARGLVDQVFTNG